MRKNKIFFTLIVFSALLALLSGCLDVEESLVINQNGSGKYQLAIIVDQSLEDYLSDSESSFDLDESNFEDAETYSYYNENGDAVREIIIHFDNMEIFIEEFNRDSDGTIHLALEEISGGKYRLTQEIDFSTLKEESDDTFGDQVEDFFSSTVLSGSEWRISVTAPYIEETNGRLSEDGSQVDWNIEFADVINSGAEHKAYVVYNPNKYLPAMIAGVSCLCLAGFLTVALIAFIGWRWYRRPKVNTIQVIEVLDSQQLLDKGSRKDYYLDE